MQIEWVGKQAVGLVFDYCFVKGLSFEIAVVEYLDWSQRSPLIFV